MQPHNVRFVHNHPALVLANNLAILQTLFHAPPLSGRRRHGWRKPRTKTPPEPAPNSTKTRGERAVPALRTEPQNSGANQPEPKIVAPKVGKHVETKRRPSAHGRRVPTPAANHAVDAGSRPSGVSLRRTRVCPPPAPYPFKIVGWGFLARRGRAGVSNHARGGGLRKPP